MEGEKTKLWVPADSLFLVKGVVFQGDTSVLCSCMGGKNLYPHMAAEETEASVSPNQFPAFPFKGILILFTKTALTTSPNALPLNITNSGNYTVKIYT